MKRFFNKARLLALSSLILVSLTGVLLSQSTIRKSSEENKSNAKSPLVAIKGHHLEDVSLETGNLNVPSPSLLPAHEITSPGCLATEQVNICTIVKNASSSVVLITANEIERDYSGSPIVSKAIGSGFFIGSDLIVTNNHVVENAPIATIRLANGQELLGNILIRSNSRDLAIIRVNTQYAPQGALPPPLVLRSEEPQVGELTIALGHPRGLEYVVATYGRVSAKGIPSSALGRKATDKKTYIQTDTAINPGNSGGPLLDASGKVIGVNAAIMKDAEGIAFSLENRHLLWLIEQLRDKQEKKGLVN